MENNQPNLDELQREVDRAAEAYNKGYGSLQAYEDAQNDAIVGLKGYTAALREGKEQLKTSFKQLGSSIIAGAEGASVYNNVMTSGADAVDKFASKFGIAGKLVGGAISFLAKWGAAANEQADKLFGTYNEISRVGATGADGMKGVFNNLQGFGYKVGELSDMANLVKNNSEVLAQMGGTVASGTKQFAAMSTAVRQGELGQKFREMGMDTNTVNAGIANYMKTQAQAGTLQSKTSAELAKGAQEYILQQDKMTKLTGMSADKLAENQMAAMRVEQFNATISELEAKAAQGDEEAGRKRDMLLALNDRIKSEFGPDMQANFQAAVSGFNNDPKAQKFRAGMPEMMRAILGPAQDAGKVMAIGDQDRKNTRDKYIGLGKTGNFNTIFGDISDYTRNASKRESIAATTAMDNVAAEQDITDAGTKNMSEIITAQRNATMQTDKMTNLGIVPATASMNAAAKSIDAITRIPGAVVPAAAASGTVRGGTPASTPSGGGTGAPAGAAELSKLLSSSGITGSKEQANILAQIQAESGGVAKEENLNYKPDALLKNFPGKFKDLNDATAVASGGPSAIANRIYGGRMGNTEANDGYKYRGRGLIQLTGKSNYEKFGKLLNLDLVGNPDLANNPEIAQKIAVAYFKDKQASGTNLSDINSVGAAVGYAGGAAETAKRAQIAQNIQTSGIPKAATGGVLAGPNSGYSAMLHGTEAVIPLPDGKTIPVQMASGDNGSDEQLSIMAAQINKLDILVSAMQKQNDLANKILRATH